MNHRNRNRVVAGLTLGLTVGIGAYLGADPGQVAVPTSTAADPGAPTESVEAGRLALAGGGMRINLPPDPAPSNLDDELRAIAGHTPASLAEAVKGSHSLPEFVTSEDGKDIMIELLGHDTKGIRKAIAALAAHGLRDVVSDGRLASGWMPIERLSAIEANADVQMARALPKMIASLGRAENQGHVAMLSDEVRRRYELDGAGIKVGIISTSFNLLTTNTMQDGIVAGDLPGPGNPNGYTQPVRIVAEGLPTMFSVSNRDEGRAMAELVHDIAPSAEILFASPQSPTSKGYADAMEALAGAGADIIVDDLSLAPFVVPYWQDDTAARKVNELEGRGIHYFTSAGNYDSRATYEVPWTSQDYYTPVDQLSTFDYDPGPAFNPSLDIVPTPGATTFGAIITLQWDEPWPGYSASGAGARNQLRMVLLNEKGERTNTAPLSALGGIPAHRSTVTNRAAVNADKNPAMIRVVLIKPKDGLPNPGRIKIHLQLTNAVVAPSVNMQPAVTGWGHNNARGATVVGASSWFNTPRGAQVWNSDFANLLQPNGTPVGSAPVPLSPILSHLGGPSVLRTTTGEPVIIGSTIGQTPILFDNYGNRLVQPELRQNPWIVATDANQTSFFGVTVSNLQTRPFFFGTSAAAPNAAAVGALLLQVSRKSLTPAQLKARLASTAADMDNPFANGLQTDPANPLFSHGYDIASGHGLIQALAPVEQIVAGMSIQNLSLSSQCSTATGNRWRIGNPNSFGVRVNISGTGGIRLPRETSFGASLRENLVVPPGGLNFETPGSMYSTTATLSWKNTSGSPFFINKTKTGSWTACP